MNIKNSILALLGITVLSLPLYPAAPVVTVNIPGWQPNYALLTDIDWFEREIKSLKLESLSSIINGDYYLSVLRHTIKNSRKIFETCEYSHLSSLVLEFASKEWQEVVSRFEGELSRAIPDNDSLAFTYTACKKSIGIEFPKAAEHYPLTIHQIEVEKIKRKKFKKAVLAQFAPQALEHLLHMISLILEAIEFPIPETITSTKLNGLMSAEAEEYIVSTLRNYYYFISALIHNEESALKIRSTIGLRKSILRHVALLIWFVLRFARPTSLDCIAAFEAYNRATTFMIVYVDILRIWGRTLENPNYGEDELSVKITLAHSPEEIAKLISTETLKITFNESPEDSTVVLEVSESSSSEKKVHRKRRRSSDATLLGAQQESPFAPKAKKPRLAAPRVVSAAAPLLSGRADVQLAEVAAPTRRPDSPGEIRYATVATQTPPLSQATSETLTPVIDMTQYTDDTDGTA